MYLRDKIQISRPEADMQILKTTSI